jgi:hypothetical protein
MIENATNVIYVGGLSRRVFWFTGKFNKIPPHEYHEAVCFLV